VAERQLPFTVRRLEGNPILHRDAVAGVGRNINGPSLIAAPPWLDQPLGRYYLYFAHHRGTFIRLATADELTGPWQVYQPGTLRLAKSLFPADGRRPHIASPDVHVDEATKTIRMYYHGLDTTTRVQQTRVATSTDGLHFEARPELLGRPYFRVFQHDGWWYALGMPGILYRSADGLTGFERGPRLFERSMRHTALLKRGNELLVFWSRVGDSPERILCSPITLDGDWTTWQAGPAMEALEPEEPWEGAAAPLEASERGWVDEPVRQLRDPAIFEEADHTYLLYSVAGESGIAIAELEPASPLAAGQGQGDARARGDGASPDIAQGQGTAPSGPAARLRSAASGLLTRIDPGQVTLRQAAVVMAATLAAFGTALLIEHLAHLSTSIVILAVALSVSMGRIGQRAENRSPRALALAAVVLPFVAVAANEIGTRIFQQPDLGDALFVLAMSATIWVRRFGPAARRLATFATFPLVAMLIVPAPVVAAGGSAGAGRWWSALVALIAFGYVTAARLVAERVGFLDQAAGEEAKPASTQARNARRIAASTKMALQMGIALGAAFAVGRGLFGVHWTWVVLTAFIVCSGNRGRGDVLDKALTRLIGAAAGTLAATALTGAFPPRDPWSVAAIFAVLGVGLWLRSVNYAFWAGAMTAALALLYGYFGERGIALLGTRLEAIVAGAALAVAASWFLLPVRTTDILRRDLALSLAALDAYLAAQAAGPEAAGPEAATEAAIARSQQRFTQSVRALDHAATLLRKIPALATITAPLRSRAAYLPAITALEACAAQLPSVTAALARLHRDDHWPAHLAHLQAAIGDLRQANAQRLPPDPQAWSRLPEALASLPETLTTKPAEAAPPRNRRWLSSQKILGYANRVHAKTYELLSDLSRDQATHAYLIQDAEGHQAHLTWTTDTTPATPAALATPEAPASPAAPETPTSPAVPPPVIAAGHTPSGYPYKITQVPAPSGLSAPSDGPPDSGRVPTPHHLRNAKATSHHLRARICDIPGAKLVVADGKSKIWS
jgi:Fusaric acid resistance protein-like